MRVRAWWTTMVLAGVAVACGDQPTELVPERQQVPAGQPMARGGMIALATSSSDDGLSISTDKDDYQPGDTVWFTGAGWPANDTLDILLEDEPATHEPHTWSVAVGEDGTFRDSTYVVDVGDIGVTFTLTATSRATERWLTVVFTDNVTNIVMLSALPTPFSPNQASSTGIKDQATITLDNGSGAVNNISVRIRQGTALTGDLVKAFASVDVPSNADPTFNWDGKNTALAFVADGAYTARLVTASGPGAGEQDTPDRKRTVVVDNTNPTVAVEDVADGTTGAEMTVTGTATDATAGLEKVEVTIRRASDDAVLASGDATNTGTNFSTWSFTYTPPEASAQKASAKATDNAGNNLTSAVETFTVAVADADAPEIDCTVPDQAVWYGTNVTVSCTASDAGSGLEDAADASFSLSTNVPAGTETENAQTGSREVCDNDGHCATAGPYTFKVDRKDPEVLCGTADGAWHATDVSIACTATDGGSGLAAAGDASFNLMTSVPNGTETSAASTNSRNILDAVGNSVTAGPIHGNKVDKKTPATSCGAADGVWHATDVSIACTATDGGSGLANAGDGSFQLTTTVPNGTETSNALTGTKNVLDAVGNSATAGPVGGNKVDKKAPVTSCGAADGAWHADDVAIGCTAADGGSGLAIAGDAGFSLATTVPNGTETSNALTGTKSILDAVGNSAIAGPIGGNMIDKKGPVVTLTCPVTPVILGASATADWTATDGGSGVALGFAAGNIPLETGSVGPKTATAAEGTSRDDVANDSPPVSCGYSVVFDFRGFFTPVDNNGILNVANSGQAIPLKWELRDHLGNPVTTLSSVKVTVEHLSCGLETTTDAVEEYAAGASGLQNHGNGAYQFNWKTPTGYAKSCKTMKLDLGEGTPRTASFQFRK